MSMNVSFSPQDIRNELAAHNAELSEQLNSFTATIASINDYCSDDELLGLAYDAHKSLFMEGHILFLNASSDVIREHQRAHTAHLSKLNILTHGFYDRMQFINEIEHLNASIASLQSQIAFVLSSIPPGDAGPLVGLKIMQIERRRLLQEKLDQLAAYESSTQGLYSGVELLTQRSEQLLSRIEGQRVNPATGEVSLPALSEPDPQEIFDSFIVGIDVLDAPIFDWNRIFAFFGDGDINWDVLRLFGWDEITSIIRHIKGHGVMNELLSRVRMAEAYLNERGFPSPPNDPMLLLQKLNDWVMMEQIQEVIDADFPLSRWRGLNTEERKVFLQDFANALTPIFGLEDPPNIRFITDSSLPTGRYLPSNNRVGRIQINENVFGSGVSDRINDFFLPAPRYNALIELVIHELRHAYQSNAHRDDSFIVSAPTLEAWRDNFSDYIMPPLTPRPQRSGEDRDDWDAQLLDYMNQPLEIDAIAFGQLREWRIEG